MEGSLELRDKMRVPEEKEQVSSTILLEFFRHSKKGKKLKEGSKKERDIKRQLSPEGRRKIKEKFQDDPVDLSVSVGYGSITDRARESSGHRLAAGQVPDIIELTEDDDITNIKERMPLKVATSRRLDPNLDTSTEMGGQAMTAFKNKEFIKWMANDSDRVAVETKTDSKGVTSYSEAAGNVAELVLNRLKVAKRWDDISKKEDNKNKELHRTLTTHGGIQESFLMKVIEKTEGRNRRDEFIEAVGNQFVELEGFKANIINMNDGSVKLRVHYKKVDKDDPEKVLFEFEKEVDRSVLEEIIGERDELKNQLNQE